MPCSTARSFSTQLHCTQLRFTHRQLITNGSRSRIAPINSPVPRSCAGRGCELRARQQRRYVMKQRGSDAAPSYILTASQSTGSSGKRRLWAGIPTPRAPAARLNGGDGLCSAASRSALRARECRGEAGRGLLLRSWSAARQLGATPTVPLAATVSPQLASPAAARPCHIGGTRPRGVTRRGAPGTAASPAPNGPASRPRSARPRPPRAGCGGTDLLLLPCEDVRGRRSASFAASSDHNSQQPGQEGPAPPPPAPRRAAQPAGPGPRTARPAPPSAAAAPALRRSPALPHRNPRTAPPGAAGLQQAGMGAVPRGRGCGSQDAGGGMGVPAPGVVPCTAEGQALGDVTV